MANLSLSPTVEARTANSRVKRYRGERELGRERDEREGELPERYIALMAWDHTREFNV